MENVSKEDSVLEEVKEKPKRRRRSSFAVKRRLSSFGDQLSSPHCKFFISLSKNFKLKNKFFNQLISFTLNQFLFNKFQLI